MTEIYSLSSRGQISTDSGENPLSQGPSASLTCGIVTPAIALCLLYVYIQTCLSECQSLGLPASACLACAEPGVHPCTASTQADRQTQVVVG